MIIINIFLRIFLENKPQSILIFPLRELRKFHHVADSDEIFIQFHGCIYKCFEQ